MNVKLLTLVSLLAPFALAACGQSGQQSASPSAQLPSSAEVATPVPAGSVQPVPASAVTSAESSGQACSLDTIDGNYADQVALEKGKPHVFQGWLENHQQQPAGAFSLVLVGSQDYGIPARTGVKRPDVASVDNNPALETTGFNFTTTLDSVLAGDYEVRLMMAEDGKSYWCDTKKSVILK